MKSNFSKAWIASKKPNKQRKYRFNAPLHIKGLFLNVHLSKELRTKYNTRSLRARVGDKVRIMRGKFKKQEAKVEEVNVKDSILYLSKIEFTKRDGTKARYPLNPSNVMLVELNLDDKKRTAKFDAMKKKEAGKATTPATKSAPASA
jgi:large subunit ribosomal protein L24